MKLNLNLLEGYGNESWALFNLSIKTPGIPLILWPELQAMEEELYQARLRKGFTLS